MDLIWYYEAFSYSKVTVWITFNNMILLLQILLHDPSELNFQRFLKILTLNSQKKLCEKLVEKYKQYYEPWRDIQEPLAGKVTMMR